MVGGFAALVEWLSFAALFYGVAVHYILASVIAFILGTGANAFLSRQFAFLSKGRSELKEVALIYLVSIFTFLINMATFVVLVELLQAHVMLAKIAGTGFAFFINYLVRQFYIFNSKPRW